MNQTISNSFLLRLLLDTVKWIGSNGSNIQEMIHNPSPLKLTNIFITYNNIKFFKKYRQ